MHLHKVEKMDVVVEPELHDLFSHFPGFGFVQTYYNQDMGYAVTTLLSVLIHGIVQ